jgi:hypothetical protein
MLDRWLPLVLIVAVATGLAMLEILVGVCFPLRSRPARATGPLVFLVALVVATFALGRSFGP